MSRRSRRSRFITVACLAGAVSVGVAEPARAVWFGAADMNLPANAPNSCAYYLTPMGPWPTGATSCTWFTTSGVLVQTNPLRSNIVPKGIGFITAFKIRTGAHTGAMRLTVLKSLRDYANAGETACCVGDEESPVFTPLPNQLVTYPLQRPIPVYNGPESTTSESFNSIAISLLDLRSSIPANVSSAYALGAVFYPSIGRGQERFVGETATMGYQVLLQAEWEPQAGVTVPASSVPVHNGAAVIPLWCRLGERCDGILRLQDAKAKGAVAARGPTTYGSTKFTLKPGQKRSVRLVLSSAGRRLMARYRTRQVWANTSFALHARTVIVARRLTLHR